jgi:hypothetical protein
MSPVVYARFLLPVRALRRVLIMVSGAALAGACVPVQAEAAMTSMSIDNARWFAITSRADWRHSAQVASEECQRKEGKRVENFYYESRSNQQWRFVSQPHGTYAIVVRNTRQAMTVVPAAGGVEIRMMHGSNTADQQWIVKRIRSYYVIHPAGAPHRSLSLPPGKLHERFGEVWGPLGLSGGSGEPRQQWLLEPSYTVEDAPPLPCRPLPDRPIPAHLPPDPWHPATPSSHER